MKSRVLSVNYEKIQRKTEYILEKLKYLRKNRPENLERFIDDETLQMSILYAIHVSIEATVDITIFIGTKIFGITYTGDYEMFESLYENGIIQEDVFKKLRKLNGLRNAIVHAYDSLIIEEIYGNYDEILRDISYIIDGMTELITE